ncbi:MAG: Rpn family recombination-promoting nuclease/putative transposase [Prevotellaceae bacterium]|jgi:predicted transposase/invertase (TIGR01784 family)|nr:Rpn family recombination-promoting nuclease/putative transposase [Prevotellaceae bacterium]
MAKSKKSGKNKKDKELKSMGAGVFMNIKTDYAFRKIFGYKEILISFLNALNVLPEKILDIQYLPPEQLGHRVSIRKATYDIFAKMSDGKHFVIEMQIAPQTHFAERLLFYLSHLLLKQIPKGLVITTNEKGEEVKTEWEYEVDGAYVIAILDFVMFKEKVAEDIAMETVRLIRERAKLVYSDKYKLIIIELPKFKKKLEELIDLAEKWILSIGHIEEFSECPESMKDDESLRMLYEITRIENLKVNEMRAYKQSVLEYEDVVDALGITKQEGIEIGRREGRQEGRREEQVKLIKRLYESKMSSKQIAKLIDLTEKEIYLILGE